MPRVRGSNGGLRTPIFSINSGAAYQLAYIGMGLNGGVAQSPSRALARFLFSQEVTVIPCASSDSQSAGRWRKTEVSIPRRLSTLALFSKQARHPGRFVFHGGRRRSRSPNPCGPASPSKRARHPVGSSSLVHPVRFELTKPTV